MIEGKWNFDALEVDDNFKPLFGIVCNALNASVEGLEYLQGKNQDHRGAHLLLGEELLRRGSGEIVIQEATQLLNIIQAIGYQKGWFSEPPKSIANAVLCEPNVLLDTNREQLLVNRKLEEGLRQVIDRPCDTPELLVGIILVSIVHHSGVVSVASLKAAVIELKNPINAVGQWWYLNLRFIDNREKLIELRRLFLDPVTASLIIRNWSIVSKFIDEYSQRPIKSWTQSLVNSCIGEFGRAIAWEGRLRPSTVVDAAHCRNILHLPPMLSTYASRKLCTQSIPEAAWRRLLGYSIGAIERDANQRPWPFLSNSGTGVQDLTLIQPLLRHLDANDSVDVSRLTTAQATILEWLRESQRSSTYQKLVIQTAGHTLMDVYSQWEALGDPCVAMEVSDQFILLSKAEEDLTEKFVSWFNRKKQDKKNTEAGGGVSANWISGLDLKKVLSFLDSPQSTVDGIELRNIIGALLRLVSLGMRRNEALKLRNRDLERLLYEQGFSVIRVYPHDRRRLKSRASKRHIPVTLSRPEDRFYLEELKETGDPEDYLITEFENGKFSDHYVFVQANTLLQEALGDGGVHLHHLRHGTANTALICLMADSLGLYRYRGRCELLDSLLDEEPRIRRALAGTNQSPIHALRAVTMLLGHLDPEITVSTYLHCFDWLLYFSLDRSGEEGYSALLAAASGLTEDAVKQHQRLDQIATEDVPHISTGWNSKCTTDGYKVISLLEKRYPGAVARDDSRASYKQSSSQEQPLSMEALEQYFNVLLHKPSHAVYEPLRNAKASLVGGGDLNWPTRMHGEEVARNWVRALRQGWEASLESENEWQNTVLNFRQMWKFDRGYLVVRAGNPNEELIDFLRRCGFRPSDWMICPMAVKFEDNQKFRNLVHWKQLAKESGAFKLRPLGSFGGSGEGVRWALDMHWIALEVEKGG